MLIERSRWTELTDVSRVRNLMGTDIDINILRVLSLGLKFGQKPTRINLLKALSDIHQVTTSGGQQNSDGDQLRGALWSTALKLQAGHHTFPMRFCEALDFLKKQTSWIIMPSDKSGGIVIINRLDYIMAAEDMLADGSTYKF